MSKANNSFISSTFWSERIGFVAALATINFMKKNKTWKFLISSGNILMSGKNCPKSMNCQLKSQGLSLLLSLISI